jgi:3-hydroxyisobutyrate dehydrogenase-like beta-hydroxyacid dehydrogenase
MSESNRLTKGRGISIIGCGLMGAALARALAKAGFSVSAWNRTPDKAQALAADGVRPVSTTSEAVARSPLVIACTATYETTQTALEGVADWNGKTLVNVGTGSPDDAVKMQRWATARGAEYLDGAILAYPQDIGTPEAMLIYAGTPSTWAKQHQTLMTLGGSSYFASDDVRAASIIDTAMVAGFFSPALAAYVEAATYAASQGLSAEALSGATQLGIALLGYMAQEAAAAIESGNHGTEAATLETYAEGCRNAYATMRRAGQQARLLRAALDNMEAAEEAGYGALGFFAQSLVINSGAAGV